MAMIAACGLDCSGCPAHLATINNDQALREKTAHEWSALYKAKIEAPQINCMGCLSEGDIHFGHCAVCAVRACAGEKGLANCAPCADFPCQDLEQILSFAPEARQNLERLRTEA